MAEGKFVTIIERKWQLRKLKVRRASYEAGEAVAREWRIVNGDMDVQST